MSHEPASLSSGTNGSSGSSTMVLRIEVPGRSKGSGTTIPTWCSFKGRSMPVGSIKSKFFLHPPTQGPDAERFLFLARVSRTSGRFSGFYETELDNKLKGLGIRYLIVTGCTTSVCVESTIRDAMFRDYSPVLLADCTAEPVGYGLPRSNHEATLLLIQLMLG